jgi:hypothetical protein
MSKPKPLKLTKHWTIDISDLGQPILRSPYSMIHFGFRPATFMRIAEWIQDYYHWCAREKPVGIRGVKAAQIVIDEAVHFEEL